MCPAWEVHMFSVTALDSDMSNSSYPHSTTWKSLGEFQMSEEEIPESVLKTISDLSRIRFLLLFLLLLFIILKTEV